MTTFLEYFIAPWISPKKYIFSSFLAAIQQ